MIDHIEIELKRANDRIDKLESQLSHANYWIDYLRSQIDEDRKGRYGLLEELESLRERASENAWERRMEY